MSPMQRGSGLCCPCEPFQESGRYRFQPRAPLEEFCHVWVITPLVSDCCCVCWAGRWPGGGNPRLALLVDVCVCGVWVLLPSPSVTRCQGLPRPPGVNGVDIGEGCVPMGLHYKPNQFLRTG